MSQVTQITIDNVAFGTFRSNLNDTLNALNSMHSGTSRPASATTGTIWLDTTNAGSNSLTIKFFDGTDDITVADVDTSANTINFIDSTVSTELLNDLSPQLGGNLDLNSSDITGTGNINITGTVTATSFSGDGSSLTGVGGDVVDDTTPQLGGNLDLNSNDITGTGNINITGNVTATGNLTSLGIDDNATSTAITIDSSENVGIGTASPDGSSFSGLSSPVLDVSGTRPLIILSETDANTKKAWLGLSSDQFFVGGTNTDTLFYTNNTEKMRIESNGRALFSTTGTNSVLNASWKYQMRYDGASDAGLFMASEANANGTGFIQFNRSSTTGIGSITRNGTADSVNYNTTSDYRMKENVIDLSDATTRVKQLQPKRFSWISQESDTATQDGFIAHEVQSIVPEAVTGTKDEVEVWKEGEELPEGVSVGDNKLDDEGNTIPKYQGIDQSKLVPLLTASLKEALTEIDNLKARVSILEGN